MVKIIMQIYLKTGCVVVNQRNMLGCLSSGKGSVSFVIITQLTSSTVYVLKDLCLLYSLHKFKKKFYFLF